MQELTGSPARPADRAGLDSAYARAMGELVERYPDDLEVATLHAEALMDLRPWQYWAEGGQPQPGTEVILANLERVIELNPRHPGACHFYIHAVEEVFPERALPCAERLAALMPGAGHIVHMPGHIYIRVGRFVDAIEANHHAIHADETFIEDRKPEGVRDPTHEKRRPQYPDRALHRFSSTRVFMHARSFTAQFAASISTRAAEGCYKARPDPGLRSDDHHATSRDRARLQTRCGSAGPCDPAYHRTTSAATKLDLKTHVAASRDWRYCRGHHASMVRQSTGDGHVTLRSDRPSFKQRRALDYR